MVFSLDLLSTVIHYVLFVSVCKIARTYLSSFSKCSGKVQHYEFSNGGNNLLITS